MKLHLARVRPHRAVEATRQATDRAWRTTIVFVSAGVIAAGYIRVQRLSRRLPPKAAAAAWEAQHRKSAARLAKLITRLQGMMIKSGQYLSARPDLVPEAYVEALAGLQDAVPPRPYRVIVEQVQRELGVPIEEVFTRFDRTPVASASLAQVHRATLKDGRDVAVKVLYPGIEGLVASDLRNLGLIVGIVGRIWRRYDFRAIYGEVKRLVPIELDFHHEAENAERIRRDLAERGDVKIPGIIQEFSRSRVLVMEYIDGIKVSRVAELRAAGLDPSAIAECIIDIFGDQVLGHGFFHGDPHPGNIFILRDGRVALIDFGQALELTDDVRAGFALLSHSGAIRDPAGMIRAIRMVGVHLPESDIRTYMQIASRTLGMVPDKAGAADEDQGAQVNVQMARGFRGVSLEGISGEALFVFRVQGMLRGLRSQLGNPGNVFTAWDGYANQVLDADARESA